MVPSEIFIKKKKIFIFDLDGVLINSKKNMQLSWEYVKKKYDLNPNFQMYEKYIGLKFEKILDNLKISKKQNLIKYDYYKYSIKNIKKITLMPFTKNLLSSLKTQNKKLAILTSKDHLRTKLILKKFKLDFKLVFTPKKGFPGKPNPAQMLKILKKTGLERKDAVYFGDMKVDLQTAKNAKIDFIFVKTGFTKKLNCKFKIRNFNNLIYR